MNIRKLRRSLGTRTSRRNGTKSPVRNQVTKVLEKKASVRSRLSLLKIKARLG